MVEMHNVSDIKRYAKITKSEGQICSVVEQKAEL